MAHATQSAPWAARPPGLMKRHVTQVAVLMDEGEDTAFQGEGGLGADVLRRHWARCQVVQTPPLDAPDTQKKPEAAYRCMDHKVGAYALRWAPTLSLKCNRCPGMHPA